jgi:hypothetical protein
LHTLVDIQLKLHKWEAARESMRTWISASDKSYTDMNLKYLIDTFKTTIAQGKAMELIAMLRQSGMGDHWGPWAAALSSFEPNNQPQDLDTAALEIRKKLTEVETPN